jgi:hypothetical protein
VNRIANRGLPHWVIGAFTLLSLAIAAGQARVLGRVWPAWRAGAVDSFPHEHQLLVLGGVAGMLIILSIPLPLLHSRAGRWRPAWRWALRVTWVVLMGSAVVLLDRQRRLMDADVQPELVSHVT